ncbi:flagellar assembly protein FliH [Alkalicoccus urumqiensis]|uniref:flagellar assembly protein FliH n=1 Tax=Alkalicoccus urumqiensis TaxID=1548213 RepID=UPI0015E59E6F|nr:flagellar assembly protein FliH [Alkalicoccus urumqiensis]
MSRLIKSRSAGNDSHRTIGIKPLFEQQPGDQLIPPEETQRAPIPQKEELEHLEDSLQEVKNQIEREKEAFDQWKLEQQKAVEQEAEERWRTAAEEGFEKGYQDAVEEAQRQVDAYLVQAGGIVESARSDYWNKIDSAEQQMVELAVKAAGHIIGKELEADAETCTAIVKKAVAEVREQEYIKIYVHPYWYETLLKQKEEIQAAAMEAEIVIYPDGSLPENGCVLDTPVGRLDAGLDVQLFELKRQLSEQLKEEGHGGA